jgi:hypothetical protein
MRFKTLLTSLLLATAAIATTACTTMAGNDAPRAERSDSDTARVPSGYY